MYTTCLKLGVLAVTCALSATLCCISLASTQQSISRDAGGGQMSGRWLMNVAPGGQSVRLSLRQARGNGGGKLASVHLPVSVLEGWDATPVTSGAGRAHFRLTRDAGTFTFDGQLSDGKGEGEWTFAGDTDFARELEKHAPGLNTMGDLFTLALNDVGRAYLAEMGSAGYAKLSATQLVALYSNGVRADYVIALRRAGYDGLTPNELLALKTNGVTSDFIRRAQERGHKKLPVGRLVSLRVNGSVE